MAHTMVVDKPVAGRGITMQAAEHTKSDGWCGHCRGVGHFLPYSTILKAKE